MLTEIWTKYLANRGSEADFVEWCGVADEAELLTYKVDNFCYLPVCKRLNLIPMGGSMQLAKEQFDRGIKFSWTVVTASENLTRGDTFSGEGRNYQTASLSGLATVWEMIVLRKDN